MTRASDRSYNFKTLALSTVLATGLFAGTLPAPNAYVSAPPMERAALQSPYQLAATPAYRSRKTKPF